MDPHQLVGLVGPTNNFAMGGLPMHLAQPLLLEGKSLPKGLFLDVMVEKTQKLIEFVKKHLIGLCVTANISGNTAVIHVYDNLCDRQYPNTTSNLFSNFPNLENQLFQLYTEINAVVHDFMPDDIDSMPELEDITDADDEL